ncbi:MAG: hypothetical protein Q7S22_06110 [Candidatus Micrarchaeota archaeon]|nr:hypothetical protein [Candidatus Micrarchaeota archaeon]
MKTVRKPGGKDYTILVSRRGGTPESVEPSVEPLIRGPNGEEKTRIIRFITANTKSSLLVTDGIGYEYAKKQFVGRKGEHLTEVDIETATNMEIIVRTWERLPIPTQRDQIKIVFVKNLDRFDPRGQIELAKLIKEGRIRIVATLADISSYHPQLSEELRSLIDYT